MDEVFRRNCDLRRHALTHNLTSPLDLDLSSLPPTSSDASLLGLDLPSSHHHHHHHSLSPAAGSSGPAGGHDEEHDDKDSTSLAAAAIDRVFPDTEDSVAGVDFDDDDDEDDDVDFGKDDLAEEDDDDDSNHSSPPTLLGRFRSQTQKESLNLGASTSASLASFSIASIMGGGD
ncbi:putative sister of odd and bowel-like [Homarus americanus]|uniref:Putative sister of odd and bowel-like n=1 Tax=Homarus americanus TaxID=6706 RepID=A0A8J5MVR1_HOMAM|nr:putative sister of odd and bowel-like [Homarus americanus]